MLQSSCCSSSMRSSILESSLISLESVTYKDSSPISTTSIEYSPQSEESELQQDIMSENYDPGEGPSSGNLQDKCSICDFATYDRQEIIQHLTTHIMSRSNSSLEVINMALNQLRHFHSQEGSSTPSRNDCQDDEKCAEESGMPRMNSQGKVKTFPCKNCEFKAMTKLEYWRHIRIHIKPNKLMSCYKCPFVTEYKHHLEYHLLNHTGAKPYKCPTCSYTCVNKSMLNSHMKSHSSVYQYRCQNCEYATKYCHTLKQHLRKYNHQPAAVLNADGTLSPMVIDVYGTRRGPKQRPKNSNKTSTSTATTTEESSASTSTATQTVVSGEGNNSNSNENNVQPSTSTQTLQSTSTQALPSTSSGSASATVPTSFTVSMLASMFNGRRSNNLVVQKDEQTGQETVHYPFQYNHPLFTLNMATQQLLPNGGFGLDETTQTTATSNEAERQSSEGAEEEVTMTTATTNTVKVNGSEIFEGSTAMPLDLTSSSLRNKVGTSKMAYQQSPLNLASSPKVAGTRRRKGIAIKLEHRIVEKEEDTDEETTQSEKRLCQSNSPQAASAPSTSLAVSSSPSTSSQAASIPSVSFMAASTPSTSLMAASTSTAPSSSAGGSACPSQHYENTSTQSESPSSQDHFVCPYCDILFPDQTVYIAHTRYHDNSEPFTCNMCGMSYGNRQKFNLHIFEKRCLKHH